MYAFTSLILLAYLTQRFSKCYSSYAASITLQEIRSLGATSLALTAE
jgi:hypothetical protein